MSMGRRWGRLRIIVPLILLVMILMRLVWMQLRTYPTFVEPRALISLDVWHRLSGLGCASERRLGEVAKQPPEDRLYLEAALDWMASPGFAVVGLASCGVNSLELRKAIQVNEWILAATVMVAALMTRFITSSWTMALIVGAMLLSRGRLLADIGMVSADYPAMLLVTTWLAASAHFLRTGALVSLAAAVVAAVLAALFDKSMVVLALAMPILLFVGFAYRRRLARPVIRRLRGTRRRLRELTPRGGPVWPAGDEVESGFGRFARSLRWVFGMEFPPLDAEGRWRPSYARGSLFRTINVPFLLWAYWRRRWLKLACLWFGVFAVTLGLLVLVGFVLGGPADGTGLLRLAHGFGATLERADFRTAWASAFRPRVDLHLAISFLILLLCAFQSPAAGLSSFLECTWLVLVVALLLAGSAFLADAADLSIRHGLALRGITAPLIAVLEPRRVLLWLEPALLSLGVAGIYNLMKVLDTWIAEKG